MLPRRIAAARPLFRTISRQRTPLSHTRFISQAEIEDPDMNGGYINPPREKRQHRDPYGDWWDKVERRNFGEPVHEDNDVLGMLSPEDYNHFTPAWGAVLLGTFVAAFFGVLGVVYVFHPEKPMHPRRFPGGLDKELGGAGAVHALNDEDVVR